MQSAFRIRASTTREKLLQGDPDAWDSGIILSPANHVRYAGIALQPRQTIWFQAEVCDKEKVWSVPSEPACFTCGVNAASWRGCWIGDFPRLRKKIVFPAGAYRITLYAATPGMAEFHLDGKRFPAPCLSPSDTNRPHRISYAVYDLTQNCGRGGKHTLEFWLAPGWQVLGFAGKDPREFPQKIAVQIYADFPDGSLRRWSSGPDWEGSPDTPVISSHLYHGEEYDARKEDLPAAWSFCREAADEPGPISPPAAPPIQIVAEHRFVSAKKIGENTFVLDFGVNRSGWIRLDFTEKSQEGRTITLRFGEFLHPDGSVNQSTMRQARSTDVYHSKAGKQTWRPHFTCHGFRYVQIDSWPSEPRSEEIVMEEVHNDLERSGFFHCSDPAIQQVYDAMVLTLAANFHDKPTDCPQRSERLGWLGGGHSSLPGCAYTFDAHAFYRKWYRDVTDGIDPDSGESLYGETPNVWARCTGMPMHYAHFSIPWKLFTYFDDREIVEDLYPLLKRNLEYLRSWTENGIFKDEFNLNYGDWLASEFTPHGPVDTALYFAALRRMEFFAGELHREADKAACAAEAEKVRDAFNARWLSPAGHYLQNPHATQALNAMALVLGLVPDPVRKSVENFLLWSVEHERGSVMATGGYVGLQFIFLALEKLHRHDLVSALFRRREYPSWGYMLENGATTLWERWEYRLSPEMNGHNQFAQGACVYFCYRMIAGLRWPVKEEGKRLFHIVPDAAECDAECSFMTPWGRAGLRRHGRDVEVEIPPCTEAVIDSPGWSDERGNRRFGSGTRKLLKRS